MAVDDAREFPLLFGRNVRNCGLRQNFPKRRMEPMTIVVDDRFLGRPSQRRFKASGAPHDVDTIGGVCAPDDRGF